jgi:hypothetical protein
MHRELQPSCSLALVQGRRQPVAGQHSISLLYSFTKNLVRRSPTRLHGSVCTGAPGVGPPFTVPFSLLLGAHCVLSNLRVL